MTEYRILKNKQTDGIILHRVRWCSSILCRFRGLMLRKSLPADEGYLFIGRSDSKVDSTIHMLFMRFDIGVIWINSSGVVVDKRLAKTWRPAYAPKAPAKYFIEANPDILDRVQIGDVLQFDEKTH